MRVCKVFLSSVGLLGLFAGVASAQTLYSASELTTPDQQGWLYQDNFTPPLLPHPVITAPTAGNLYTTLNSTASRFIQAGYGIQTPTPIVAGARFSFDLQVLSESHVGNDRAGLSVIVLGNNLSGIELGFWSNNIWAQNVGFTHGEDATFNTTGSGIGLGGLNRFDLFFSDTQYTLYANGGSAPLLTGSLRNYSAFGSPYNIPNGIFVGDDTTSASASFRFSQFSVAPEPASLLLMLLPIAGLVRRKTATV